jgi:Mce-associated membrane protein
LPTAAALTSMQSTSDEPSTDTTPLRLALLVGLTMALALAVLIGVLGMRAYHAHEDAQLRAVYLQVGRQGAVNLTTIDWQHADADVQRILSTATGPFHDDFSQRSQPFVDVVKKVQSISTGTVAAAGLESSTDTEARVLVAVNVQTTTNEAPEPALRAWRMRISVQHVGDDVLVSNVEFVS